MGNSCGGGLSPEEKQNKTLEKFLANEKRKKNDDSLRLLMLGAGESGKSTLFKQMKILYTADKFSKSERHGYIGIIHDNIISNMKRLVAECDKLVPPENSDVAKEVLALPSSRVNGDTAKLLKDVWADNGVKASWKKRSKLQVQESLEYFIGRVDIIADESYVPSDEDILHTRVRTSGVVQEDFIIGTTKVLMYDVGGQRNERRKWMHKFDDVTAIIYVTALSEYDQVLFEDNVTSRQQESLNLFSQVYNSEYFSDHSFIIFLNKEDLFRKKLPIIPFRVVTGENPRNVSFTGPYCEEGTPSAQPGTKEFKACVEAATKYIQNLYEELNTRKKRIYFYPTNATHSENMDYIMKSVKDIVLTGNLERSGLLLPSTA